MTITDFLLARFDEDGVAILRLDCLCEDDSPQRPDCPDRIANECQAKRKIVDEHPDVNDGDCGTCIRPQWGYPSHGGSLPMGWPCPTLRALALPYADHPDCREEWKP